jgi:hypothetical protein
MADDKHVPVNLESRSTFRISGASATAVAGGTGDTPLPLRGAAVHAVAADEDKILMGVGTAAGTSNATGVSEAPDIVDIRGDVGPTPTVEALWEIVRAQHALLEATIRTIPSAARHIGPDHNGGPYLAPTAAQDLIWGNHFLDLIADEPPRSKREVDELVETARTALATAKRGNTALQVFALGIVAGAGHVAGQKTLEALMETPWWTAFYARLAELASAILAWAQLVA